MAFYVRPARVEDCAQISDLHLSGIRTGFLSDLGPSFLCLLYRSMIASRNAFCKIAGEDGRVIGFISGAESTGGFYREFLKKNSLKAGLMLFRKMAEPKTLVKIFETLLYPAKRESAKVGKLGSWGAGKGKEKTNAGESEVHAELFSIVVDEKYRSQGIAQGLFLELKIEFERRGIKEFKVVAGSDLKVAYRFYEKMGGVRASEIEVHKGEKSLVYVWNLG